LFRKTASQGRGLKDMGWFPYFKKNEHKILLALAEHRKEHGYFVLAGLRVISNLDMKFHRVPSHKKGARLLCFGGFYFKNGEFYFEQKNRASH
jgi:hypothetical protein